MSHLSDAIEFAAVARKNGYGHYKSSIGGRSPSLRWPHLYDLLRAKGYSKEKAARISNSRVGMRKHGRIEGLPYKDADKKSALKKVLKTYNRKHHLTASIEFVCYGS